MTANPDSAQLRNQAESPQGSGGNQRPIRVLHVINDLSIGGAEIMLYRLLSEKNRDRFEPVVLSLMDRGSLRRQIEALGIKVHTAGLSPHWPSPLALLRLVRVVREIKPDLIQGWLYHGSLAAQFASYFCSSRPRVIWSIHASLYARALDKRLTAAVVKICAPISRLATNIIFVSRSSQVQHGEHGYSLAHSCVLPNGINTDEFVPAENARLAVRSELGLPADTILIGLINRYHAMKDYPNFLRAAAAVAQRDRKIHFLLAGREVDSENCTLMKLISELKLQGRTHLLSERTDVARLLAALDIFSLSSSHGESFPIIVGEAMSCGVPCVVTDVGDSSWMVNDTGKVVPPRDATKLGAAWSDLLEAGPETRKKLGLAARKRVVTLFSLSSVVASYEALYEKALATQHEKRSGEPRKDRNLPEAHPAPGAAAKQVSGITGRAWDNSATDR